MRKQLCVWILVLLCVGVEAQTNFTDSLHLIVHHQKVVNEDGRNKLQFDISVYRPNDNWNGGDVYMGDADFYFMFNENAFSFTEGPELVQVHQDISLGGGQNALTASASMWWASSQKRLRVGVRKNTAGNGIYPELLLKDTVFIARVRWEMAPGNRDPHIVWDMTASGVLSSKNYPIIPTFIGDVDKYPEPGIFIDDISAESDGKRWACEGSDVLFYVNARSTGNNIRYQWQYALEGGDWNNFDNTPGEHSVSNPAFNYLVHGLGDTLVVRHAPGTTDGMRLQCVVSDPTLAAGVNERTTEEMTLQLRDSIRVFLSAAENGLTGGSSLVGMCPGATGKEVRLNVWGPTNGEEQELGDVYVSYYFINETGSAAMYSDTIRSFTNHYTEPGVGEIFTKNITITEPGTYLIANASTSHCYDVPDSKYELGGIKLDTLLCNAGTYTAYDTIVAVYSTSPDTAVLDRYSIAMGVDTNLMTGLTGTFDQVVNIYNNTNTPWIGDVITSSRDTLYRSKGAGLDTVLYIKKIDGCDEVSIREIEVINNLYAQVKVYLDGPMTPSGEMNCFTSYVFPQNAIGTEYVSPYDATISIDINKFQLDPVTAVERFPDGNTWCDWIYLRIMDQSFMYVDSVCGLLRQDGIICDLDGNPYIAFPHLEVNMSYYIVVEHQNHISVRSESTYVFSTNSEKPTLIDLTNPGNICSNGNEGPLKLVYDKYCLYAGDLNRDGFITTADVVTLKDATSQGVTYQYDVNQDGLTVLNTDKIKIVENNGKGVLF